MDQALLEIGLYFDERTDPETQEHMSLQDVADKLMGLCCKNSQRNAMARKPPLLVALRLPLQTGGR